MSTFSVENVIIFVADGLRWDVLPDYVDSMGVTFKTVAMSLYSPPSFASLLTGLYPQQHGVYNWNHQLPESVQRITDSDDVNGSYYNEGNDRLFEALRVDSPTPLRELEPPFFYLERDNTTHYPYEGSTVGYSYFRNKTWTQLKEEYLGAVHRSAALAERRLETLKDRGLLEETLVVFTSDHGELFGEHGEALHTAPACPELAFVPTVFIHPSLSDDSFLPGSDEEVIEHVDIVETVKSAMATDVAIETMGTDILSHPRPRPWGYNHTNVRRKNFCFYAADSIWWRDGGHAVIRNNRVKRLLYVMYLLTRSIQRDKLRERPTSVLKKYLEREASYGSSPMSISEAKRELKELLDTVDRIRTEDADLDAEARERLRELGYLA